MRGARVVLHTEGCPLAFVERPSLNYNTTFCNGP